MSAAGSPVRGQFLRNAVSFRERMYATAASREEKFRYQVCRATPASWQILVTVISEKSSFCRSKSSASAMAARVCSC